jgi:hypothetical protein
MEAVHRFVALPSNLSPILERERRRLIDGCTSDQMKWIVRITLFAALIFLADTRLSLFAFGTAAAYGLYENARTRGWNKLVWTIPFLIVFMLLTLSVSVPLIGWSPYLSRTGLTVQEAGVFSLEPAHLVGLILPPQSGNIEMLTYIGLSVLVLAGLALVMMPRKLAFWLALLIFAALYALGTNGFLWTFLVQIVPGLIWFRVPSRAWFIVVLVAPLLAGYGMQWLIKRMGSRTPQRWRLYALTGLAASLACGISTLFVLPLPDSAGWSALIGGGGLTLVVFVWLNGWLSVQRGVVLILIVVFADLLITGRSWLEWRGEEDWLVPYETLATRLIEENAARIYSPSYSLPQQVAEAYNLRLFGGVDPFQIESVVAAIAQAGGIEQVGYSVVVPPLNGIVGDNPATANRDAIPDTELLAEWEVSHVIAAYPIEHPRLEIVNELDDVYIYRNQDYTAPVSTDTLPNWSLDETKLPAPATVEQLNRLTLVASVIAGFTLIMVLILALKMRH